MTASQDEHTEATATTGLSENKANTVSPGEILREGRLAHDYSVDDLCAQTKLGAKTINALEDNDFQALSQPVFARGYYRQCAKVLDIDAERISRAYSAWAGEPEKNAPASVSNVNIITQDVSPGGSRFGWLLLLVVIVGAAIAIMLLVSPGTDNTENNDSDAVATASTASPQTNENLAGTNENAGQGAATSGQPDGDDGDTGPVARTGETTSGRNVNQSLGITPPNQGQQSSTSGSSQGEPTTPANELTLTFEKRSWVRVTDAEGNRLASGIFEAGHSETFEASAPYQIRLGFAPGVKVSIGGEPVDVAARTNGSSVANISVAARGADDDTSSDAQ